MIGWFRCWWGWHTPAEEVARLDGTTWCRRCGLTGLVDPQGHLVPHQVTIPLADITPTYPCTLCGRVVEKRHFYQHVTEECSERIIHGRWHDARMARDHDDD